MSQFPDIHRYRLTAGTQDEDPSGRRQPWNAKLSRNTKMKIHAINLPLLSLDVWLWVSFCRTLAMSQQSCIRPSLKVVIDLAHGLRLCECCQSRARMGLSIARLRARALRRQNCLDRIGFPVHAHFELLGPLETHLYIQSQVIDSLASILPWCCVMMCLASCGWLRQTDMMSGEACILQFPLENIGRLVLRLYELNYM